ncbi:2-oxoglutarate synthase subunit KorB [uncultured archaeon]|nr:2-oxoglutarate synthase subunit KorB [uncultured archaeon]
MKTQIRKKYDDENGEENQMVKPKLKSVAVTVPLPVVGTTQEITWCPGCPNFLVLAAWKNALTNLIKQGYLQENFAMCAGIGCHPKIYDYLNISGVYGLHGRVLPVCLGMKLGNPNLKVLGFSGDGDAYAEGMEHFIHAARYNADITYFVANNQSFALTTGQSTPTSAKGFKSKAEPDGEYNMPLNPIKLALAAGASFVARINPKDIPHTQEIIEKAIKHKGFAFIESIQDCLIFDQNPGRDKLMYKIDNGKDMKKAMEIADSWDYNSKTAKIPIGIIYQEEKPILEEKWPQLRKLRDNKISWKNSK